VVIVSIDELKAKRISLESRIRSNLYTADERQMFMVNIGAIDQMLEHHEYANGNQIFNTHGAEK
jgi:hypothetical protein